MEIADNNFGNVFEQKVVFQALYMLDFILSRNFRHRK